MDAPARLYRVTLDHPVNGPAASYEIMTRRGAGGAAGAALALVTMGGTRPTDLRVASVVELPGESIGAYLG